MGNAHPLYAPHNVYPCWGVDRWLALEIHCDEEFVTLCNLMGRSELAADARFADMASRKQNEAELDRAIEAWTRERDRDWLANHMCEAGLRAAPSRDHRDLYADPHLRARGAFARVEHPEAGELELVGTPWRLSGTEAEVRRAPLLGEHNDVVLGELLGLSEAEINELRRRDVIL